MKQDKWTGKEDAYRARSALTRVRTRERERATANKREIGEKERKKERFEGSDLPQIAPFTGVAL